MMENRKSADAHVKSVELAELLKQRDQDVTRFARLNEALVQQCESYMRTIATMQHDHVSEIGILQQACEQKSSELEMLRSRLMDAQDSRRASAHVTTSDTMRINQLQAALLSADNEVKAQIRARLEAEANLKRATDELRQALRASVTKDDRLRAAEDSYVKLQNDYRSAHERLDAVRAVNEQLSKSAAATESKLHRLEEQVKDNAAAALTANSLKNRLQAAMDALLEAKKGSDELAHLREQSSKLSQEKANLIEEVQKLRQKLDASKSKRLSNLLVWSYFAYNLVVCR
jgi:chromosome segregation ATPase